MERRDVTQLWELSVDEPDPRRVLVTLKNMVKAKVRLTKRVSDLDFLRAKHARAEGTTDAIAFERKTRERGRKEGEGEEKVDKRLVTAIYRVKRRNAEKEIGRAKEDVEITR